MPMSKNVKNGRIQDLVDLLDNNKYDFDNKEAIEGIIKGLTSTWNSEKLYDLFEKWWTQ